MLILGESSSFHCVKCPKKFYDANGLKRHSLIHTKEQNILQSGQIDLNLKEENEIDNHLEDEIETQLTYERENENYNAIFNIGTSETTE